MLTYEPDLHIPVFDGNTNFWMVRTKGSVFFQEFISEGYIAIGWNAITKRDIDPETTEWDTEKLKARIKTGYKERNPTAALNKCIRFCCDMRPGDIAVIAGEQQVAFAVVGDYYEEPGGPSAVGREHEINKLLEQPRCGRMDIRCPYIKRREITLIKAVQSSYIRTPYLQAAISRNLHSLSSMNDYAQLILSCCYDAFIYRDKLTMTFRVEKEGGISAYDLSTFVFSAAKALSGGHPERVDIQTALHSPGDIVLQVMDFVRDNAFPFLLCYIAVFGGRVKDYEFHSIFGAIGKALDWGYEKDRKALELRKLKAEVKSAEQDAVAKELNNLERRYEVQQKLMEECAGPLVESAEKLQIVPDDSSLIDLSKIFRSS